MKVPLLSLALLSSAALAQTAPVQTPQAPSALFAAGQTWTLEAQDDEGTLRELGTLTLERSPDGLRAVSAADNRFFTPLLGQQKAVVGFFRAANGVLGRDAGRFCLLPDDAVFAAQSALEGLYFEGSATEFQGVLDASRLELARLCLFKRVK